MHPLYNNISVKYAKSSAQTCPTGVPTSVINISDSRVNKLQGGPPPLTAKEDPTSFWAFIAAWGGNWMWRNMVNGDKSKEDMHWVADGMPAGTLIWTTNGYYDRKQATYLLGVGWIIFCKATRQQITGLFGEQSITASLFRAEMLGLCAFHLLARAITEHYNLSR